MTMINPEPEDPKYEIHDTEPDVGPGAPAPEADVSGDPIPDDEGN